MSSYSSIKSGPCRLATGLVLGISLLGACSTYNSLTGRIASVVTPYRVTVVQGNFVSREAAAKLSAGMTREQVRALLGTPLLADMFHANRWDYIFYFKRGSTSVVERRDLTVFFDKDLLARWAGAEDLPSEQDLIALIDGDRRENSRSRQLAASNADTRAALAADRAASGAASGTAPAAASAPTASAPTASAPVAASDALPPNQRAADAANNAMAAPEPVPTATQRNPTLQPARVSGPAAANPQPQRQLRITPHPRMRLGESADSTLAAPPAVASQAAPAQ